jgi:hypothetical protein
MEMNSLQKREEVYSKIKKECSVFNDKGIFFNIKIKEKLFKRLQVAYSEYIYKTLLSYYGKKNFLADWRFEKCDFSFLSLYSEQISKLPNNNLNGSFRPKKETVEEYNQLQGAFADIIVDTGLINFITGFQMATPRVVNGITNDMPLSAGKYHADIWANQTADALVSIVVGGDMSTTVEFCSPTGNLTDDFFLPLEDYDHAFERNLFEGLEFLSNAKFGCLNIFDNCCVHRTLKQGSSNYRIGLEAGFSVKDSDFSDFLKEEEIYTEYRNYFLNRDEFTRLGKSLRVEVKESIFECDKYNNSTERERAKFYYIDEKNNRSYEW